MTFQSLKFIVFFLCAVIVIFTVPRKAQNTVLFAFNLFFAFFAGGIKTLCFLLVSTISTFFAANFIQKSESMKARKCALAFPFILNLALLFVMKYLAFFTTTANGISKVLGFGFQVETIKIFAPIGISFYTLWMLGYLLDVYWQSYGAEKNFINYAVFATYFPLIISGPIVRFSQMKEEFAKERNLSTENVSKGVLRICWGFFEKMVISDNIAKIVDTIYGNYNEYSGVYILFGTACFAIQLYTDFSGCMDIALGCSKILGIKLPENFDTPFFAKSISEYWRRWHITLGTWFKDYLMYPVLKSRLFIGIAEKSKARFGKKAGKKIPVYCALVILWFSIGFWHGGLWKYIIGSGLLHCFYMICSDALDGVFKKTKVFLHINDGAWWWKLFQMFRTFLLVCSGFVFFRAGGVRHALNMLKNFFKSSNLPLQSFGDLLSASDFSFQKVFVLALALLLLFSVSLIRKIAAKFAENIYEKKTLIFILSVAFVLAIYLFAAAGKTSFIYFQF